MTLDKWFPSALAFLLLVGLSPMSAAEAPKDSDTRVKHVDPKEAQKLIDAKKVIVLDVRTPGEFKSAHIAGATNIDFQGPDFESRITRLDTNKVYLVHCASGGRSTHCLPVLQKHNFQFLFHLDGGLKAWQKAELPVEKDP